MGIPDDQARSQDEKLTLLDTLKDISKGCQIKLSFLHLMSNGLNGVNIKSLTWIAVML